MSNDNKMVTLANGSQVPWDEFSAWHSKKQVVNLNPPNKGKKFSLESCLKAANSQREYYRNGDRRPRRCGAANKSSRAVVTFLGHFPSIKSACVAHNITKRELMKLMKLDPIKAYFVDPVYKNPSRSKPRAVKTPEGIFPSLKLAANHFGVSYQTINTWISGSGRHAGQFSYADAKSCPALVFNAKPVMTPKGKFDSLKAAATVFNVHSSRISKLAKSGKEGFYFLDN